MSLPNEKRLLPHLLIVLAVFVVVVAAWLILRPHPDAPGLPAARTGPRPSIAIVGFQNSTGDSAKSWMSTALAETIAFGVAEGNGVRVSTGEEVATAVRDLSITAGDGLPPESLLALQQILHVDSVVSGACLVDTSDGGRLKLVLKLQKASDGTTVLSSSFDGAADEIFEVSARAASALREKLGASALSPRQIARLRSAVPSNAVAAERYALALEQARSFRYGEAIGQFEQALLAAPQSPAAHFSFARLLFSLGFASRASQEANAANAHADDLPPMRRAALESLVAEVGGDLEGAAAALQHAGADHPDERQLSFRLVDLLLRLRRADEAARALDRMRSFSAAGGAPDPRLTVLLARLAGLQSDPGGWHSASVKAAFEAKTLRATSVLALARLEEGASLLTLERPQEAAEAFDKARNIYQFTGDRSGVVRAMNGNAEALCVSSGLDACRNLFLQAASEAKNAGIPALQGASLGRLAAIESEKGTSSEARRLRTEAVSVYREAGDETGAALVLHDLALASLAAGDRSTARRELEEALPAFRKTGPKEKAAMTLERLGEIMYLSGDVAGSSARLQEALHARREIASRRETAKTLLLAGKLFAVQGNPVRARSSYDETVIIREALRDKAGLAESRIAIAELLVDQDKAADAAAEAQKAIEALGNAGDADRLARAWAVLAESQLLRGDAAAAAATMARATAAGAKDRRTADLVALVGARIGAAQGGAVTSRRTVEEILARARKEYDVPLIFRCRLALGEIAVRSGDKAAASRLLSEVRQEAEQHSFVSVARKAERLSRGL